MMTMTAEIGIENDPVAVFPWFCNPELRVGTWVFAFVNDDRHACSFLHLLDEAYHVRRQLCMIDFARHLTPLS